MVQCSGDGHKQRNNVLQVNWLGSEVNTERSMVQNDGDRDPMVHSG